MELNEFTNTSSEKFLEILGIKPGSEKEKGEILAELTEHFDALILETVVDNLDQKLLAEFKKVHEESPDKLELWLQERASQIPGLASLIDRAISAEIEAIRSSTK